VSQSPPAENPPTKAKASAGMPHAKSVLNIYGYTNYRSYLRDFYELKKKGPRGYSYRNFAKSAGFSSPNIMKLIIEGKRNLSHESISKVIQALSLTGPMGEYFTALVLMNQAPTDAEKEAHFTTLQRLIPHGKKRDLNAEGLKYLSHWLHPTLREMAQFPDFKDDPYWIARRLFFPVSIGEIGQALQFLIDEGFIEKTTDGFKTGDHMVLSSDEVRSLAIRNYHRQMLELARQSLETLPMESREFGALTLNIPEAALPELKSKLKAIRKELHEWSLQALEARTQDSASEAVTQVNFQMFPLSRRVEKT